jgi:UDP-glucose-4-epimerase GalE
MRVLVTGGAGYIGSHATKVLAKSGHEPIVYDNLAKGHRRAVRWGPMVEGDLNNLAQIREALAKHKVEAVMHFAALAEVGESVANPRLYYWNNVVGTLNLLDAMMAAGVKLIIFSSSAAVYGDPEKIPIPEDHPKKPVNPYGETKLAMERALEWYGGAYEIRWMALRYFNAAGADLDGELGEAHHPESHLIPLVIQAALDRRTVVKVFGTDYPTPDGTAIRDYIHVTDLADAHVRALEHLKAGGESLALNLGTGKGHSVRELISTVEKIGGRPVPFQNAPRRAGDPPSLVADPARAAKVLGWKPRHSDLATIIESAWKWHSTNAGKK